MAAARNVAVIGLGVFGSAIARHLSRFGDHVLGVDVRESAVVQLSDDLARAVIADAREPRALAEAGLGSYDVAVICTASDIEANLLAVMNAKDAGVGEVWAKASSTTHARILERVGVARILSPEDSYGDIIAQALHNPLVKGSVRVTDTIHLAHVDAPPRLIGRTLDSPHLEKRHELRCLGVLRGPNAACIGSAEPIEKGDSLLLLGTRAAMRAFVDRG